MYVCILFVMTLTSYQGLRMNKSCPLCKKEIDDKQEPVKKSEPLNQDQAEVAPLVE
jgi:hypothetical protein